MLKRCVCCGKPFEPRPQVPGQAYCPLLSCQRARKRQWQQAKLQADPDYRINQRAAQQAWSQRNQDYWRSYRRTRPEHEQHHRKQQRVREAARNDNVAKMDVCSLPSGLYRITRHPDLPRGTSDSCVVEITLVSTTCPCKMDTSREDLIDTQTARP